MSSESSGGFRPARRTIVKGAAWAVPAVTVASAAPALAASPDPIEFSGTGCKIPNQGKGSQYYFVLAVDPTVGPADIDFTYTWSEDESMDHNGQEPGSFSPGVINVPSGETRIVIRFITDGNAANGALTISYTYAGVDYNTTVSGVFSADCEQRGIDPF